MEEIKKAWDDKTPESKQESVKLYCSSLEWGDLMGFKLEDRVTAAKKILKLLGYPDDRIEVEEWRDLTKEKLDEKLSNVKKEAFKYEQINKDKDSKYA